MSPLKIVGFVTCESGGNRAELEQNYQLRCILRAKNIVEPFYAMDVLSAASKAVRDGHPVISMATGQPSHKAPKRALEAAKSALDIQTMGYTDAVGISSLRAAISNHYQDYYGVEVSPERIMVTNGSSAAFNLVFLSLFAPGATIAIAKPGYPAYRNILKALRLNCVEVQLSAQSNYTLTPEVLEDAERVEGVKIDGVLLASPANPTGTVTSEADLRALSDWCEARGTIFISDEIYHGLTFAGQETTAASFTDNAVIINSFSKYYCMTGWRIGWMILPEHLIRPIECLAQSMYISAPELSQIVAEVALTERDELDQVVDGYRKNRELLLDALPRVGLPLNSPMDGAFYAYVDVSSHSNDSMEFSKKMLKDIHVAAVPGLDFDIKDGAKYMRFSYAGSESDIAEAVDRLEKWLR